MAEAATDAGLTTVKVCLPPAFEKRKRWRSCSKRNLSCGLNKVTQKGKQNVRKHADIRDSDLQRAQLVSACNYELCVVLAKIVFY